MRIASKIRPLLLLPMFGALIVLAGVAAAVSGAAAQPAMGTVSGRVVRRGSRLVQGLPAANRS
jgi:hypothetical protein